MASQHVWATETVTWLLLKPLLPEFEIHEAVCFSCFSMVASAQVFESPQSCCTEAAGDTFAGNTSSKNNHSGVGNTGQDLAQSFVSRGCSKAVSNNTPNSKPVGGSPRVTQRAQSGGSRVQHLFGKHCCIWKICWCPGQRAFLCEKAWDFCQYHGLSKLEGFFQVKYKMSSIGLFLCVCPSQVFWSQRISHKLSSHVFYRLKVRPSGKRPNYDNSNRRLMAKTVHREKWLGYFTRCLFTPLFRSGDDVFLASYLI